MQPKQDRKELGQKDNLDSYLKRRVRFLRRKIVAALDCTTISHHSRIGKSDVRTRQEALGRSRHVSHGAHCILFLHRATCFSRFAGRQDACVSGSLPSTYFVATSRSAKSVETKQVRVAFPSNVMRQAPGAPTSFCPAHRMCTHRWFLLACDVPEKCHQNKQSVPAA